jgi:hypothetical protein
LLRAFKKIDPKIVENILKKNRVMNHTRDQSKSIAEKIHFNPRSKVREGILSREKRGSEGLQK